VASYGRAPGNPLDLHVTSFGSDIRRCEVSVIISWLLSRLSLMMPFGRLFGISFGTVSVAVFALVRHGSGSFDLSSLSGAFAGILDVCRMLGALIVSNREVRSLALHRVCLLIHLQVCLPSLDSVHLSSFSESKSIHPQVHLSLLAVSIGECISRCFVPALPVR